MLRIFLFLTALVPLLLFAQEGQGSLDAEKCLLETDRYDHPFDKNYNGVSTTHEFHAIRLRESKVTQPSRRVNSNGSGTREIDPSHTPGYGVPLFLSGKPMYRLYHVQSAWNVRCVVFRI